MDKPMEQAENTVHYELGITAEEAAQGAKKVLSRNNKKLEVVIPAGVSNGSTVKLTEALKVTDGRPGDIIIQVKVKIVESASAGVVQVDENSFESEVLKSELPVVVDFWAAWCAPCRMMAPVFEKLAAQYNGRFKFCKLNVDENPQLASRYQAMSIPLLVFFRNGEEIDRSLGAIPEAQLKAKVDALL
jgi:thioredoxin 1